MDSLSKQRMKRDTPTFIIFIISATLLILAPAFPAASRAAPSAGDPGLSALNPQVAWQEEYDKLEEKIDKEFDSPGDKAPYEEYLRWMEIKAEDRDKASAFSTAAQQAGNPFWFERFQDLAERAQNSGKSTVAGAVMRHIHPRDLSHWADATHRAGEYGKPLYAKAVELRLDADNVREAVRCNMRFSIGMVESNDRNSICLYRGRSFIHGHDYDAEGNLFAPNMDFDITCLPRSAFQLDDPGDPDAPADVGLAWVEKIREICSWFKLFEFNEATDLMEQYLIEALCMLPSGKGHAFFLKLAEDYDLPRAGEYIEGFYAKLKGKVEVEDEDGNREPAAGAVVTVTDPHDGTEWVVEADNKGKYEIEKVLLHRTCGPFPITAEHEGDKVEDEYEGPLEEPDKDFEHEKDLLIKADTWEGTIAETWEMKAGEDESALAAIMHRGEYDAGKSWRVRVKLKRDRGNENVVIYALDEARLESFSETLDMTAMRMEREGRRIEMSGQDRAEARGRRLSKKECDLELVVQLKKKTYIIRGKIDVAGIAIDGEGRLDVKVKPIVVDKREETGGTAGINEEIEITGTFKDEKPVRLSGSRDEMANLPGEFRDFIKALAGKIEWKVSWDLSKRKKD